MRSGRAARGRLQRRALPAPPLAVAYAESRDFDRALATILEAREINAGERWMAELEELEARARLYRLRHRMREGGVEAIQRTGRWPRLRM